MAQAPSPPHEHRPRLGEILAREGAITQEQLLHALKEQKTLGGKLGRHLVDLGYITEVKLIDVLSRQLRIPKIDLGAPGVVAANASSYARADLCEQWAFCPVSFDDLRDVLVIAIFDPDPERLVDIEGLISHKVEARLATLQAIEEATRRLYHVATGPPPPIPGLQRSQTMRGASGGPVPSVVTRPQPPEVPPTRAAIRAGPARPSAATPPGISRRGPRTTSATGLKPVAPRPPRSMPPRRPKTIPPRQPTVGSQRIAMTTPKATATARADSSDDIIVPGPGDEVPPTPSPPVAPVGGPLLRQLQDRLQRLEGMVGAQSAAIRSLIEVLAETGVLSVDEMNRRQKKYMK